MTDKNGLRGNVGLVLAAVIATALGLGSAWWLAQPDRSVSQFERLGQEIGCQCGTCPMRPIATCGCGFADGMLGELQTASAEGLDDEEVMAVFASRYGDAVRIKPASSGLDLTAWAAPMLLLTLGSVFLAAAVIRWARPRTEAKADPASPTDDTGPAPDDGDRIREIVEREISELES